MLKKRSNRLAGALALLVLAACSGEAGPSSQNAASEPTAGINVQMESEPDERLPERDSADEPEDGLPEMTPEQQAFYDEYVSKLLFNGMLAISWSPEEYSQLSTAPDGRNLSRNLIMAFEDLIGPDAMAALWEEHGVDIPADVVEEVLLRHFPFTVEQLHEILDICYNVDRGAYSYEGGRGGGPIAGVVTAIEYDGEYVRLPYELYFGDSGQTRYSGVLTLRQSEDGWVYWSVEADDLDPEMKRDVALRAD